MRTSPRVLLAAIALTLAALAAAPSASAQATVEVSDETTGQHCPAVVLGTPVTGGCVLSFTGEIEISAHMFGIEVHRSDCVFPLLLRINEGGEGYVTGSGYLDHDGVDDCFYTECALPWPAHLEETGASPPFELQVELCYKSVGGGTPPLEKCAVTFPIQVAGGHSYASQVNVAGFAHTTAGNGCEFLGSIETTSTNVEIAHT